MVWSSGGAQRFNGAGNLAFAQHPNTIMMAARGNQVTVGVGVTAQGTPDLTVAVALGTVIANGIVVNVSADATFAGTPTTFATSQAALTSGQAQFVYVHADSSGTVTNTEGTAATAGQQLPPEVPEDEVLLAMITLTEGDTTIDTVDIDDERQFTPDGFYTLGIVRSQADSKGFRTGASDQSKFQFDGINTIISTTTGAILLSGGNVGIGIAPTAKLHVNGAITVASGGMNVTGNITLPANDVIFDQDNKGTKFGEGQDAIIAYDGIDLIVNTQLIGSGSLKLIPSATITQNAFEIIPSASLDAGTTWKAIFVDGAALDPAAGAVASLIGLDNDFSGVGGTNDTTIIGHDFKTSASMTNIGLNIENALLTTSGVSTTGLFSVISGATGVSSTYEGVLLSWTGATRSANAPQFQGVQALLPADLTNFGTSFAAKFTADGRSVIICDTTYALDTDGEIRHVNLGSDTGTNILLNGSNELKLDSSSLRYKENVESVELDYSWLSKLKPKTFNFIGSKNKQKTIGYIAEDVEKLNSVVINYNNDNQVESIANNRLMVYVIEKLNYLEKQLENLKN